MAPPGPTWESKQLSHSTLRWHDVVKEYSRLQLGLTSNRLPALSGLATQMRTLTGDKYLAGLWYNPILEDILWYVEDAAALKEDQRLPGPSWSWA
jgi:hypothetical protein